MYNNFNSNGASSYGNASQGMQNQNSQGVQTQYQGYQRQYQPVGTVQSFYSNAGQQNQAYGQSASPNSFHTANYRGNQPGHDAYLRSDSENPAQQQQGNYQGSYSSFSGMNSPYAASQNQQFSYQTNQQPYTSNAYGNAVQSNQAYSQSNIMPNAYHTANYRGNQPGHDAYLRSDSVTPAQQQQQSFQSQAGYGSQQNSQSYNTGFNNVGNSQQFGYNNSSY
ncbi:hypothetical protein [Paenibacillus sp. N3.4]|uniref:hypothetical protein n=1 Tax=Paenibacillus sp. N3.4 TaxID=2603222 RepID=UPI0011C9667E|nr:hypothetical protein [Paenibacillus sp. N3.4]TXK85729.1 hypothetical protein FU659_02115 [Paenibacillus sp. N3.4]